MNDANLNKKLHFQTLGMQKSHKMKRICSLFRSIVYSIKENLLSLRSEFHLRRKESLKFSRRQETSTFQSQKHYVKTRRPIAHTRYRGVGIDGIQQSSRWRCVRPTVFLLWTHGDSSRELLDSNRFCCFAMSLFVVCYPFFFTRPSNIFFMAFKKVLEGLPARIP